MIAMRVAVCRDVDQLQSVKAYVPALWILIIGLNAVEFIAKESIFIKELILLMFLYKDR